MKNNYIVYVWYSVRKRKTNIICMTVAVVIYCFNQLLLKKQFVGIIGYFCKCYLNDLVCPLFFLSYSQIILIWAKYEIRTYTGLLFLGMTAGFIWEYFAPFINPKAVSDIYDLICYFCGIQIYYFVALVEKKFK